jgi:hypothetical protein
MIRVAVSAILLAAGMHGVLVPAARAAELSGEIAFEGRLFPSDPLDARQQDLGAAIGFEPEFYHDWADGDQRFVVVPYLRWDLEDSQRTHGDLRELYWRRSFAEADLYVGLRKVFWGLPSPSTSSTSSTRVISSKTRTQRTNWVSPWFN